MSAGITLEIETAAACDRAMVQLDLPRDAHHSGETVVYDPDGRAERYREVDYVGTLYREFQVNTRTGFQLNVSVPIECKSRRDVEYFVYELNHTAHIAPFPLASDHRGSQLFQRAEEAQQTALRGQLYARTVGISVKDGQQPEKVEEEDLLYKAGGALYDFITFDLRSLAEEDDDDAELRKLGIIRKFDRYISRKRYHWSSVLRERTAKLSTGLCEQYYKGRYGNDDRGFYSLLTLHLPIVCVNGPLYKIERRSDQIDFEEVTHCITTFRKQSWPGDLRDFLGSRSAEVPVFLTNPAGLSSVIEVAASCFRAIDHALASAPPDLERRWLLEAAFFRAIARRYRMLEGDSEFRSDLDRALSP